MTGLLLFTDGKFMQYLEGPKAGVLSIFETIKSSSLHQDIVEISLQPLERREYGDWSMAFLADIDAHVLPLAIDDDDGPLIDRLEAASAELKGIDFRNGFDYVRHRTDSDLACLFNRALLNLGLRYEEGSS